MDLATHLFGLTGNGSWKRTLWKYGLQSKTLRLAEFHLWEKYMEGEQREGKQEKEEKLGDGSSEKRPESKWMWIYSCVCSKKAMHQLSLGSLWFHWNYELWVTKHFHSCTFFLITSCCWLKLRLKLTAFFGSSVRSAQYICRYVPYDSLMRMVHSLAPPPLFNVCRQW